jgi:hypothetical protein
MRYRSLCFVCFCGDKSLRGIDFLLRGHYCDQMTVLAKINYRVLVKQAFTTNGKVALNKKVRAHY